MLFEIITTGLLGLGGYCLLQEIETRSQSQTRRIGPRRGLAPAIHRAARDLQLALIQVREAPDFRRAASYATHARDVPLWFRQRQYHRFRTLLVEHFSNLLNAGISVDSVLPGLTQLIGGLGIAPFEADYIRTEAESKLSQATPHAPDFAQQLREAQTSYRSRIRSLEAMQELDTDSREQLLEQEKIRFQSKMRAISGEGTDHEP